MDEMGVYSKAVDEAMLRGRQLQLEAGRLGALFSLNVPVIFILIGGSRKEETWFRARLRIFLQNPDACVVFSAVDCDRDHVTGMMEREFNRIAKSPAGLLTITRPIVCPVVFGHRRPSAKFSEIANTVYQYIDSQRWTQKWQPFLLLHIDDSRNYIHCKKALTVVSEAMDNFLTGEICCRCCLLCNRNSDGFAIEDENLLNTVILLTLLQGSSSAQGRDRNIAETIGAQLGREGPGKFYSARAVSIENPVIPILLDRIRAVLGLLLEGERFLSDRSDLDCEDERVLDRMDMGFLDEILEPYLRRLPQDNGQHVTLLPLYGIMPGERRQTDQAELEERAKRFYGTYYRDHLRSEEARRGQRQQLPECFLPEYLKAGGSLCGLKRILNQPEAEVKSWLDTARLPEPILIAPMGRGGFPQGAKPDPFFAKAKFKDHVTELVNRTRKDMLLSMAESEPRALLRQRLAEIIDALSALSDQLYSASLSQQSAQVSLPLTDAPPDRDVFFAEQKRWLRKKLEGQQDVGFQQRWQAVCSCLLHVRQDDPDTLADLVCQCGDIAEEGLGDSESYMQELKQICSRNSNQLDTYVDRIKDVWLFPVRLAPDHPPEIENRTPVGVGIVGNPNNLLCQKLEQVFAGSKRSSITDGDRRIDLVRLSGPFQHDELALWKTLEQQPDPREESDESEAKDLRAEDTPREDPEMAGEAEPPQSGRFAALSGLTACYDAAAHGILFRWERSAGLSYPWLYIYQLHRKPGGAMELGRQLWRANLSHIQNQCVVELREMQMQVKIMDYLVFAAASQTEVTDLSEFGEEGYFCYTASGNSQLQYHVDYGEPKDGLRWAHVHAVFSSDIPSSMICYTYTYGSENRTYVYAFPSEGREHMIHKGSYDYLPVLLPAQARLEVKATAPEFRSNLRISEISARRRKFPFWR